MKKYLAEIALLDYNSAIIQDLVQKRRWKSLDEFHRIWAIYNYICDEILFWL